MLKSKLSHFRQQSRNLSVHVDNTPFRAEILNIGCTDRNWPNQCKVLKIGVFGSKMSYVGKKFRKWDTSDKYGLFKEKFRDQE